MDTMIKRKVCFTLIEVSVASAILLLVLGGAIWVFRLGSVMTKASEERVLAYNLASRQLESYFKWPVPAAIARRACTRCSSGDFSPSEQGCEVPADIVQRQMLDSCEIEVSINWLNGFNWYWDFDRDGVYMSGSTTDPDDRNNRYRCISATIYWRDQTNTEQKVQISTVKADY